MLTNGFFANIFRWLRYAYALFGAVAVLATLFVLTNTFIFTESVVNGESMQPTLENGQFVPVCLVCARFESPHDGQIVVVQYAGGQNIRFVKRVLGVPGDTVKYNGISLKLGPNQYFIVGDNRDYSTDSRVYGPINGSSIVGFVVGDYGAGPGNL